MGVLDRFIKRVDTPTPGKAGEGLDASKEAQLTLEEGMALEKDGQLDAALKCYERAIDLQPDLARAHFNRGNILLDRGDAANALLSYSKAIELKPDSAAAHYNLGNAHLRLGHPESAVAAYRQALALKPDFADASAALTATLAMEPDKAEAHFKQGLALHDLGQLDRAKMFYRQALEIRPDHVDSCNNLGGILVLDGQLEEAVVYFRRAVEADPGNAATQMNLGDALKALGQLEGAVQSYRRASEIMPDYAPAFCRLGDAQVELGALRDAVANYRRALELDPENAEVNMNQGAALEQLGQFELAQRCFRRVLEIDPGSAEAHSNLGVIMKRLDRLDDAVACFRQALIIRPNFAGAHLNLGSVQQSAGEFDAATASYERAIATKPDYAMAYANLGSVLKDLGRLDEALVSLRRAVELDANCAMAHNNLLFIHNHMAGQPARLLLADAQRFGEMAARIARPFTGWTNLPHPERRLRVGFVSGDLGSHPVGYFLDNVLDALASQASARLELYAYPNRVFNDATSKRIQAQCHGWHLAAWLSDEALARRIRDDGIDILVDLSGHTAHNRLPVFAWKPAPVQVSWLGYFATTGVAAMDYFLADPWTLPPSQEPYFTEQVWRMPETRLCFTPPDAKVAVSPLPALSNGYVTFGCFNNLTKMNDAVVALWAQVLTKVPGSRLLLKSPQLAAASMRQRTCERFAVHGIDANRLILEGYTPRDDYLAAYQRVDIGLDPFPFPGGTTTAEALWMGIPVLTLTGERFLSRQGVGLLMNAGLADWIGTNPDDYVARAMAHASDLKKLSQLRACLRQQVLASPVFDAPRFAKNFEIALRGMWHKWCATTVHVQHSS